MPSENVAILNFLFIFTRLRQNFNILEIVSCSPWIEILRIQKINVTKADGTRKTDFVLAKPFAIKMGDQKPFDVESRMETIPLTEGQQERDDVDGNKISQADLDK